ncbi:bifunctional fucokinase/L-fucose-1-P-guanylyltransferase [Parabacteroides sp. BX2]|uniref:Bifunctional fucokinase/L-fucose-1-P-guanylyltransferase n=1 Tax=Parabacteroides segnis TaxID=2763058 RepID=A0ABR7DYK9_9BACT|nr:MULTISPECIES: bifunctional fucokinase/fucose-1-phosphate guanylyltransferase [Parabacteroides]MBC5642625.1 bifunctional fucokinase/L-fucose-1-P-guanylyltransferase [Parabacteroides segnis]MCM0711623.1 bifunctional fucokinase/fucose-1-phosphate guanylyltransferase [Parabacteroides sp. TA-V-105]
MKKLLSLPPNLVNSFHKIAKVNVDEWFCTSDPVGARLGSGGGTTWLIEACRQNEAPQISVKEWLAKEKRILLHAGGQSRRLPGYAPSGKILTPIPVFRWARGQKLSQNLLSLQLPLYEEIMHKAPDSLHTLIASGDVYIRNSEPLQDIPDVDVVCYGLWVDPALATNHGVFVSDRQTPDKLDFMLQKPSLDDLGKLAQTHLFLMDIGVWLLSDRAMELLMKHSYTADGKTMKSYDLYSEFGLALGEHPRIADTELNQLSVAILPLEGGEFYHYGTSRELISSTLAVQNLVRDQRAIMHRKVKPHPAMFVQNAAIDLTLTAENSELWIENSYIGKNWKLDNRHIITGVPVNNWELDLPSGVCIDVVPVGEQDWAARPYGFNDPFKGASDDEKTLFMGCSVIQWGKDRGVTFEPFDDLQNAPLFPVCKNTDELGLVIRWMVSEPGLENGRKIWETSRKMSANELSDCANLDRLFAQREKFRYANWPMLAANHEKSVFYQLDLADAAREFAGGNLALPEVLSSEAPLMKRIHNRMFRARVLQLEGKPYEEEQQDAFSLLREGLIGSVSREKQSPFLNVYRDQIVWGRSPVRIDLAGGWTDTPPYCMYAGGNVVNVAIELNGQPPLQVYVKPSKEYKIILRSIDLGAMEVVSTWDELHDYKKIGSPFSIPKAALALAGFVPEFSAEHYPSLEDQLKNFGCGLEVTLLAAIPAGSGLGTSSILAATVLGAISDFCGLAWDKSKIGYRTLILEQLLTTGGGWQDQYGGVLHGLKLLQTGEGFNQNPSVRWLPEYLFTDLQYQGCHLLYYTGITRTAKNILAEIVQGMFLNSATHLRLLSEMKTHALDMFEAIQCGNFETYGKLIAKTWEQKKALDSGTNPPAVEALITQIKEYALGYKLPGAGGGGYLYIVAKDPDAALQIRRQLTASPHNPNARFVEMSLSDKGLQISRS